MNFSALAPVIVIIMSFLDAGGLLQLRAVCRLFNAVFCSPGVCQKFVPFFIRAVMGAVVDVDSVADVMCRREAILRQKERVRALWITEYIAATLDETRAKGSVFEMKMKGEALRVQQQNAREFCRRATEEWLGHQADCRRVRHNICRNWFNVTSLSCKLGLGVPPVLLPDGTLCINDPPNTIVFYARRDRCRLPFFLRCTKPQVPSRTDEARRDLWCLFARISLACEVSLMHYDPYMNGLHVGLESSETTVIRVRSALVTGLEERLGEVDKLVPPMREKRMLHTLLSDANENIEFLARYSIASSNGLESFIQMDRDAVGLPDYEWDEAEMKAVSHSHGGTGNTSRFILVKQERDVTNLLLSSRKAPVEHFTQKDVLELISLQRELAHKCGIPKNRSGDVTSESSFPRETANTAPPGAPSERPRPEPFELPVESSASPVNERTAVHIGPAEGGQGVDAPYAEVLKSMRERYVFGVFNEQTTLSCSVAYTREVAVSTLSPYNCNVLGICFAGDVRKVRILKAPEFQDRETNADGTFDKGEMLIACEEANNILICQQMVFRHIKTSKRCVLDYTNIKTNSRTRDGIQSKACGRTWYFLKGYYYDSPSIDMNVLMEINAPGLVAVASPRPWLSQNLPVNFKPDSVDAKKGEQQEPSLCFSSWCPPRDGHPYFREPFMLYLARYMPYIAFPRQYTALEQQELPPEDRTRFREVAVFSAMRHPPFLVSSIAISPVHAFFLLGMTNGAILLLSPLLSSRDAARQKESANVEQASSQVEGQLSSDLFIRRRTKVVNLQENMSPNETGDDEDSEGSEDASRSLSSLHTPVSHLYRTAPLQSGDALRQRPWSRSNICTLTATELFGDGFCEDTYIQRLQSSTASVFRSTGSEVLENEMPLHAMWVLAPRDNGPPPQWVGIWSMHVDEWKLTTLSASFEVVIYNLRLRTQSGNRGVVFTPMLTLSPYQRHPLGNTLMPRRESWMCTKLRRMLQTETKRQPSGSEIMWQNGVMVIYSATGGNRYTIFDFGALFRDPNGGDENEDAPVAYSATRKEYHRCTPDVMVLLQENKSTAVAMPRHYPVLLRWHFLMLLGIVLRPVMLLFGIVALLLMMLRLDGYINTPLWVALGLYTPYAASVIFNHLVLYDRYYEQGCGVSFHTRLLSRVLMFVVFPVLFTLRHELYEKFHPPWVLITTSLDVSIILAFIPSIYVLVFQRGDLCSWLSFLRLVSHLSYFLCILFVVLFSIYFDGPSATNPKKPKFHIVIAFIPIFVFFALISLGIFAYSVNIRRKYCFLYACGAVLVAVPIWMFIGQFTHYYAAVAGDDTVRRPSLIQTCFLFPALLLGFAIYSAVSAFVLLESR